MDLFCFFMSFYQLNTEGGMIRPFYQPLLITQWLFKSVISFSMGCKKACWWLNQLSDVVAEVSPFNPFTLLSIHVGWTFKWLHTGGPLCGKENVYFLFIGATIRKAENYSMQLLLFSQMINSRLIICLYLFIVSVFNALHSYEPTCIGQKTSTIFKSI